MPLLNSVVYSFYFHQDFCVFLLKFRLPNWSFISPRFCPFQNSGSSLLIVSVSCFGFAFAFAFGLVFVSVSTGGSLSFGGLFDGLPGLPLGSCFDSGLSWLPLASSLVGNGGIGGSFLGEAPALCFAFDLLSGDCSFLCSVLCSGFFMIF